MDDKLNGALDMGEPLDTGLEFEIGENDAEQLVFDMSDSTPGEGITFELGGEPAKAPGTEEFSIPEDFKSSRKYDSDSFIDDPLQPYPTYLPRFTDVSEKYNAAKAARAVSEAAPQKSVKTEVDPTSEADINP